MNAKLTTKVKDIDYEIFMELSDLDIKNLCLVNKEMAALCEDETFWEKRTKKFYSAVKPKYISWKAFYIQTVKEPHYKYLQLSNLSRQPNKARIHYVPKGATDVYKGTDFVYAARHFPPGTSIEEIKENLLDEIISEFADFETGTDVILYLKSIGRDLREGDIIAIGDFVDSKGPERIGLYGYTDNPERLLRFESDEDNAYMFLPGEYQIITKFPPHYWSDLPETIVPLDLSTVTFDLSKDLDEVDPEKYAGFEMTLLLQGNEKVYYVLIRDTFNFDFELDYMNIRYLEVRKSLDVIWSKLPNPLNFENTLFIPNVNTPKYIL